jgi:hypothetical protein
MLYTIIGFDFKVLSRLFQYRKGSTRILLGKYATGYEVCQFLYVRVVCGRGGHDCFEK